MENVRFVWIINGLSVFIRLFLVTLYNIICLSICKCTMVYYKNQKKTFKLQIYRIYVEVCLSNLLKKIQLATCYFLFYAHYFYFYSENVYF